MSAPPPCWDAIVVGAGAAGLAAAIFARRANPDRSLLLLDGAVRPGAKILVSGGSRCNVTNAVVTERDYWGGPSPVVRRMLRAFTAQDTVAFFAAAGVPMHEEHGGKLFPDSNRSRDVLDALLAQASRAGVDLRGGHRVTGIARTPDGFEVTTDRGSHAASRVVLATGGQSLPKSGSDGAGYAMARALGHSIVPVTPALAPLLLDDDPSPLHAALSGVALDVELSLWANERLAIRIRGSMLWTHFGISGPAALDLSRHWLRARLNGQPVRVTASFAPGWDFARAEAFWRSEARERPRAAVAAALARLMPASMATAIAARLSADPQRPLAHLGRDERRGLARALTAWELPVVDSRGYNYAEVTAGGVDLREVEPRTLESRCCPGLYLAGEVLDVDGRLGGFNFQWAWSSGYVAGNAVARA